MSGRGLLHLFWNENVDSGPVKGPIAAAENENRRRLVSTGKRSSILDQPIALESVEEGKEEAAPKSRP